MDRRTHYRRQQAANLSLVSVNHLAGTQHFVEERTSHPHIGKLFIHASVKWLISTYFRPRLATTFIKKRLKLETIIEQTQPLFIGLSGDSNYHVHRRFAATSSQLRMKTNDKLPVSSPNPEDQQVLDSELIAYLGDQSESPEETPNSAKPSLSTQRGRTLHTDRAKDKTETLIQSHPVGKQRLLSPSLKPHPNGLPPHENPSGGPPTLKDLPPCGLPRLSADGIIRLVSARQLLGYWLSSLHEGFLTLLCDPSQHPHATITITLIVADTQHTDTTQVVGRSGPWVTVRWPNLVPLRSIVSATAQSWSDHVQSLSVGTPTASLASDTSPRRIFDNKCPPEPTRTSASSQALPPKETLDLTRKQKSSATASTSSPSLIHPSPAPPPSTSASNACSVTTSNTPRTLPKLDGNLVLFADQDTLRNEINTHLTNGGLFVSSSPLPLRTQQSLSLVVHNTPLPITLEAEVVYADNHTVGFSINHAQEICRAIQQWLAGSQAVSPPSGGSLTEPPSLNTLLKFTHHHPTNPDTSSNQSVFKLFYGLANSHFAGALQLQAPPVHGSIYFHEGNITFVEMSPFDLSTSLGRMLIQQRKLSESALQTSLSEVQQTSRRLGEVLVARRLVPQESVVAALREQTRARVGQLLSLRSGKFVVEAQQTPPGQQTLVLTRSFNILAQHLRNQLEQLNSNEFEHHLRPRYSAQLLGTPKLNNNVSWFGWTPKERRFVQSIAKGPTTLAETLRRSPLSTTGALRLISLGLVLGILQLQEDKESHPATSDWTKQNLDLTAQHQLMLTQNHFEKIGTHWSTHHKRLKKAYEQTKAEFSLKQSKYQGAPDNVVRLLKSITKTIEQSYALLSNTEKRIAYRQELFNHIDLEYAANMLREKGEVALLRGDHTAAIEDFEIAMELCPSKRSQRLLESAHQHSRPSPS
ncbi:MAG: DUF4388 domain-containing protein [Myxococcales bacterium]|nr:DUF4388 domain-containing protein [Myxococcales bacterium]